MENTEAPEKPFPYVKFLAVKNLASKDNIKGVDQAVDVFVNVSGSHGTPEAIMELARANRMKIVGCGNLAASKYGPLRTLVANVTGSGLHPLLRESVTDRKLKDAKKQP